MQLLCFLKLYKRACHSFFLEKLTAIKYILKLLTVNDLDI